MCVVRVLKKGTAKRNLDLGSVLCKFELERSYFDKLLDSANFCYSLRRVSSVAVLVAQPWRYICLVRDSWPLLPRVLGHVGSFRFLGSIAAITAAISF